jgi:hypothetical protein
MFLFEKHNIHKNKAFFSFIYETKIVFSTKPFFSKKTLHNRIMGVLKIIITFEYNFLGDYTLSITYN